MGSGRGGLHEGTWGSREGEELRSRVNGALKQFGGSVAGDAAAELAEALVRIAMGDGPEEAIPEPGEVAFDLALDALTPYIPGGGRVTRELGQAAMRKEPSPAYYRALDKGIVSEHDLEENAGFANELFRMTERGYFGEEGSRSGIRRIASADPAADSLELFERLSRGAKDDIDFGLEGATRRWLKGGTAVIHRSITSTPESPSVQVAFSTSDKVKDQKVHFYEV